GGGVLRALTGRVPPSLGGGCGAPTLVLFFSSGLSNMICRRPYGSSRPSTGGGTGLQAARLSAIAGRRSRRNAVVVRVGMGSLGFRSHFKWSLGFRGAGRRSD